MIIQNVEALKEWLTKTLTPICDADPQTLAKYVLALVKKEKAESDLRDLCTRELDVFLQENTKDFVEELFRILKSKGYIPSTGSGSASSQSKSVSNVSSTTSVTVSSTKPNTQESGSKNGPSEYSTTESVSSTRQDRTDRHRAESKERHFGRSRSHSRSPISRNRSPIKDLRDRLDRDDRRRRGSDRRRDYDRPPPRRFSNRYESNYRRLRRSPFRTRSRSRSRTRSREKFVARGRSRSRSRSRSARPRTRSRSFSDSRSRSESPRGRRKPSSRSSTPPDYRLPEEHPPETKPARPRCRDYDEKGFCMRGDLCPFDHGSDPVVVDDVNLPNVLGFPGVPVSGSVPSLATHQGGPPPVHTHPGAPPVHPPPVMGQRPIDSMSSQPIGPPPPGPRPPGPPNITAPTISARLGPAPCSATAMLPPGGPPQLCMKGPQSENTPPPPGTVPVNMPPQQVMYRNNQAAGFTPDPPYNPEAPSIQGRQTGGYWAGGGNDGHPGQTSGHGASLPTRRDLRSIPTVTEDTTSNSQRTVIASKRQRDGSQNFQNHNRQNFDPNRQGARRNEQSNTTLEVKKIPREFNNIAKLNEHFGKFGTIVNLQVQYGGNPEAALITFASHAQANAAYRSSEPVFNNRFIKVFWHRQGANQPDSDQSQTFAENKTSVRERLGSIPPAHKLQLNNTTKRAKLDPAKETIVVSPTGSVTKTLINPSAAGGKPPVHCRLGAKPETALSRAELEKKKALRAEELKEVMNKKLEIQKQKQALLEKQINNQKLLFKKLEKKNLSPEDKAALIQTIKTVANSIDKLKLELKDPITGCLPTVTQSSSASGSVGPDGDGIPTNAAQAEVNNIKTRQQTQKAILDTELDIISKESEGADTTELRRKVAELKRQAAAIGFIPASRGRGRGAYRSRGRGRGLRLPMFRATRSVDRRPKQVLVSGYMQEEKEQLIEHMKTFGEVESIESDDNVPSLLVTYKTRAEAENAVYGGTMFQGRKISMAFHRATPTDTNTINLNYTPDLGQSTSEITQEEQSGTLPQESGNKEEQSEENADVEVVLDGVDILEEVQEGDEVLLDTEDKELKDFDEDELLGEEEEEEEEARFWRH